MENIKFGHIRARATDAAAGAAAAAAHRRELAAAAGGGASYDTMHSVVDFELDVYETLAVQKKMSHQASYNPTGNSTIILDSLYTELRKSLAVLSVGFCGHFARIGARGSRPSGGVKMIF